MENSMRENGRSEKYTQIRRIVSALWTPEFWNPEDIRRNEGLPIVHNYKSYTLWALCLESTNKLSNSFYSRWKVFQLSEKQVRSFSRQKLNVVVWTNFFNILPDLKALKRYFSIWYYDNSL